MISKKRKINQSLLLLFSLFFSSKKGSIMEMLPKIIIILVVVLTLFSASKLIAKPLNTAINVTTDFVKDDFETALESVRDKCPLHLYVKDSGTGLEDVCLKDLKTDTDIPNSCLSIYKIAPKNIDDAVKKIAVQCKENLAALATYGTSKLTSSEQMKLTETMAEIDVDAEYTKGVFYLKRLMPTEAYDTFVSVSHNPDSFEAVKLAKGYKADIGHIEKCEVVNPAAQLFSSSFISSCEEYRTEGYCFDSVYDYASDGSPQYVCSKCNEFKNDNPNDLSSYNQPERYTKESCKKNPCRIFQDCKGKSDDEVCVNTMQQLYFDDAEKRCVYCTIENAKLSQNNLHCCKYDPGTSQIRYFIDEKCDAGLGNSYFMSLGINGKGTITQVADTECCAKATINPSSLDFTVLLTSFFDDCALRKVALTNDVSSIQSDGTSNGFEQMVNTKLTSCVDQITTLEDALKKNPPSSMVGNAFFDAALLYKKELSREKEYAQGLFEVKLHNYDNAKFYFDKAMSDSYILPDKKESVLDKAKKVSAILPKKSGCVLLPDVCCKATITGAQEQYFVGQKNTKTISIDGTGLVNSQATTDPCLNPSSQGYQVINALYKNSMAGVESVSSDNCCS